jgi:photosystem II stability/assembly factor-like uncharacterized protein
MRLPGSARGRRVTLSVASWRPAQIPTHIPAPAATVGPYPKPRPFHSMADTPDIRPRRRVVVGPLPILSFSLFCASLSPFPAAVAAQRKPPSPDASAVSVPAQIPAFDRLKYRLLGPFDGGRVSRVAGIPGDPSTYYLASAAGGVWKSTDGGVHWKPIFDHEDVSSTGAIAVAASDPNVVYVGTGEANIRGNVAAGDGIYRSLDAGKTWTHVWTQEGQIGDIVIDATNPDIVFAAVLGHAFGPNPERGVYRTEDAGRTWQQVLKKDDNTGAIDLAMAPSNPNVIFATLWQARRTPWSLTDGGLGSGLYVSRNGGDTWKQLTGHGLPDGLWGRSGVAIAPSDPDRVYAVIEADDGGLFRSEDGGDTWNLVSPSHLLTQRTWYYATLAVDPVNENDVWFPQVALVHTIDGGETLNIDETAPHGDNHDVWIDPENPRRMIVGHDGGVSVTTDGGKTWHWPPLPLGQLYHVATDSRVPYDVQGAQQDIGTAQAPNDNLKTGGITPDEWHDVGGGEAGYVVSKPDDPDIVYAGDYPGIITRWDGRTGTSRNVSAWPNNPSGHGDIFMKYRFNWTAPIAASPHDPNVIYEGAQVLFKTTDGGQTWTAISPDLTRNDTTKEQWSGGPITGDNTGAEYYCTLFAVAESPMQAGLIWAGSDDGLVHVTRDGGAHWTDVTKAMPGIPEWGTISLIEPSPFDAGTAYVVVDDHRMDDMRPYLYETTDFGKSWTRLDSSLPRDVYLHAVREDPQKRGQLYLGTERGVMMSPDDGRTWTPLRLDLPTVSVQDLVVKDNDLVLGTNGRGIWILDDLTPVRAWADSIARREVHLFPPEPVVEWRRAVGGDGEIRGANPPAGAIVNYWLKDEPDSGTAVTLQVMDSRGIVVRTLSSVAKPRDDYSEYEEEPKPDLTTDSARIQRVVWDLHTTGVKRIKGAMIDTGDPASGPWAPAGTYTLRLAVGIDTASAPLEVRADPRVHVSDADRAAQQAFVAELGAALESLSDASNQAQELADQLDERSGAVADEPGAVQLKAAVDTLISRLDSLADAMYSPNAEVTYDILAKGSRLYSRLTPLYNWASAGDGAPTQGMKQVWAEQRQELQGYLHRYQQLLDVDLANVNALAQRLGVPWVVVHAKGTM